MFKRTEVFYKTLEYSPKHYPLVYLLGNIGYSGIGNGIQMATVSNPKFTYLCYDLNGRLVERENYVQIFRDDYFTNKEYQSVGIEHFKKIEHAFWFGKNKKCSCCNKLLTPKSSKSIDYPGVRKTIGIVTFLKENNRIFNLDKNFSKQNFNNFLREGFSYGNTTKLLFVDFNTFTDLNLFLLGNNLGDYKKDKCYNLDCYSLITFFGKVNIVPMYIKNKVMCLVDLNDIQYRYIDQRNTFISSYNIENFYQDIDTSDNLIKKARNFLPNNDYIHYITECGLGIKKPYVHLLANFIEN